MRAKSMTWKDQLKEYINIHAIKVLSHHCSGTIAAIIFFGGTGFILKLVYAEGWIHDSIEVVEGVVLIGLFVVLSYKMFVHLLKGKSNGNSHSILVA